MYHYCHSLLMCICASRLSQHLLGLLPGKNTADIVLDGLEHISRRFSLARWGGRAILCLDTYLTISDMCFKSHPLFASFTSLFAACLPASPATLLLYAWLRYLLSEPILFTGGCVVLFDYRLLAWHISAAVRGG